MTNSEKDKFSKIIENKVLLAIDFWDKNSSEEDSRLILKFSEYFEVVIQTFWRIFDKHKIIAMDTDRFLLPDHSAPESDYQNLSFDESLLCKHLEAVRAKCLNCGVNKVIINGENDILIELSNSVTIQGIINCKCNNFMYYGLFCNNQSIIKCCVNWY